MTSPSRPLHLRCVPCGEDFFTLNHMSVHCYRRHPSALGIGVVCVCGHRKDAHAPNKVKTWCQHSDCSCAMFRLPPDPTDKEVPDAA